MVFQWCFAKEHVFFPNHSAKLGVASDLPTSHLLEELRLASQASFTTWRKRRPVDWWFQDVPSIPKSEKIWSGDHHPRFFEKKTNKEMSKKCVKQPTVRRWCRTLWHPGLGRSEATKTSSSTEKNTHRSQDGQFRQDVLMYFQCLSISKSWSCWWISHHLGVKTSPIHPKFWV